jgi:hypothetical protein
MLNINGTFNKPKNTEMGTDYAICNRISSKFNFNYNPWEKGIHLVFLNIYHITDDKIKEFDFSYVKKNDTVIFLLSYEGWMLHLSVLDSLLKKYCTTLNFDNVYYASEQLNFEEIPTHLKPNIKHLSFISQDSWINTSVILPQMFELKDKTFLCYNGRPAKHRCLLVGLMNKHNLLSNSLVSLDVKEAHDRIMVDEFLSEEKKRYFVDLLPEKNLTIDVGWGNHSYEQEIKTAQHHARTMISVVTETHCFEDEISFTEKIYRPIGLGHPFIVVGAPRFLKKLKSFGFKTFDGIIDESYDDILNTHTRIEKIIDVMISLENQPFKKKKVTWEKLNEIAKYNKDHFYKRDFYNTSLFDFLYNLKQG